MTEDNDNKNGPAPDTVAGVHLTHPDRVLYPDQELTKARLAQFYADIAGWILPHVVNRPLTITSAKDFPRRSTEFPSKAKKPTEPTSP